MTSEEIKSNLVCFYRESTKGDYLNALNKYTDLMLAETETWHSASHRPPLDNDKEGFSICVLIANKGLYSIGWFDFELDKWMYIGDEYMFDFKWQLLPKYK